MMRASYRGLGPYRGVVKDESGKIVAECEHWHHNRDSGSQTFGPAARNCAQKLLREMDPEAYWASQPAYLRQSHEEHSA